MSPIRTLKRKRGPKAKPIEERTLRSYDLSPIMRPKRTYSQNQKLRVLTFLAHHSIPLTEPGKYRNPTQQEAANFYRIPLSTINDWVRKKSQIEGVGRNSGKRKEKTMGVSQRVLWPQLEDMLYSQFIERREAGRTVRQGWFRIQSQFLFRETYPNTSPELLRFSNGRFWGFLDRHRISLRTITKKAQKIPSGYEILVVNWLRFNR